MCVPDLLAGACGTLPPGVTRLPIALAAVQSAQVPQGGVHSGAAHTHTHTVTRNAGLVHLRTEI